MKRYIRGNEEYIFGMSVERGFLIGKLEGYAEVIFEHIMKITVAHPTGNAKFIDKWIGDIGRAVFNSSKYTLDKNKRLDAEVYEQELFASQFGTTLQDMKYQLEDFKDDYAEYSNFDVSDELAKILFGIVTDLRKLIPNMIAEHKGSKGIPIAHTKTQIRPIVRKYIDFKIGEESWRDQ